MEREAPNETARVAVLLNAEGGTLKAADLDTAVSDLAALFEREGLAAEIEMLAGGSVEDHVRTALARARNGEIAAVVVGGGDGTLSAAAGVLAGSGVPLGVLPLGTLNHFAKDLGVPTELAGAVATIARGRRRRVDVGEVNGRVFINNSSIGVYPHMVMAREQRQSQGWSKWPAMALAFWRIMRRFPRRRLTICAEGGAEPCRTPCVFIGNNEYGTGLGSLGARERLDAGELCLYVTRHRGPLGFLRLAILAALGRLDEAWEVETRHLAAAEIRARTSRLLVARDGEVESMRPPLRYRIRPGALDVLVPSEA